jgi:hypothetical protein
MNKNLDPQLLKEVGDLMGTETQHSLLSADS